MSLSISDQLTSQFYEWERRGRGVLAYDFPVELEPPFHPFFGHSLPKTQVRDDSRHHTLISWLGEKIRGGGYKPVPQEERNLYEENVIPIYFDCREELKVFSVSLPKGFKVDVEDMEHLLIMLSNSQFPLSFEIVGSQSAITLQFVCRLPDAPYLISQVKAFFPECSIKEHVDLIEHLRLNSKFVTVIEYGLAEEFMRPLPMAKNLDPDPYIGIFGALENLEEQEYGIIQVLFNGTVNPWAESIMRSVSDSKGGSFFEDVPEMVKLAQVKVSAPLFGVAIKVVGASTTPDKSKKVAGLVGNAFGRIYFSESNSLIPLDPINDPLETYDCCILRESQRLGMLINAKELATIIHFPADSVTSTKLQRDIRKTEAAPKITEGHKLVLGINEYQGKTKQVTVSKEQRLKHTHVIGATGTGKSTLFLSLISQDIANGNGLCVLDPHGDLIESILPHIPEHRRNDVLIIDPADRDYPVGFNFFTAHTETEKDILSSDLVAVFKRLSTSWGDQMNSVLANAILAFLESSTGGTMIDLRRFLVEKTFREQFLKYVNDTSIKYYWQKEYPLLKTNSIGPILTRLDTFLRPKLIRNMVAQKKSLDFDTLLDTQKIILVKLSQGLIGNENSYLLGTVIVSKIHQAAMARQAKDERKDFFVYIDEFQNFITPSMSAILSGARKYHVGLILAHQDMQQLVKYDSELASAVVSNAGTRICFRLGDIDARRFESGFASFEARDLESLNTGEAIGRIDRPDYDFSLTTIPLQQIDPQDAEEIKEAVISRSRAVYSTPREEIEAGLNELNIEIDDTVIAPPQPKIEPIQEVPKRTPPPVEILQSDIPQKQIQQKIESQHRYLQTYIKKMAEQRGFKASVEVLTLDGNGRVDVLLERSNKTIAVEISNTTEAQWEVHNIEKCLANNYSIVISCASEKKILDGIMQKAKQTLSEEQFAQVVFYIPDELIGYLDEIIAIDSSTETRIKGYRVKVDYTAETADISRQKSDAIHRAITDEVMKKK